MFQSPYVKSICTLFVLIKIHEIMGWWQNKYELFPQWPDMPENDKTIWSQESLTKCVHMLIAELPISFWDNCAQNEYTILILIIPRSELN